MRDEFRSRNIPAIWMPHALPDSRTVSRAEIRRIVNDYMTTVMHEEPLDPSLLDFDDSMGLVRRRDYEKGKCCKCSLGCKLGRLALKLLGLLLLANAALFAVFSLTWTASCCSTWWSRC